MLLANLICIFFFVLIILSWYFDKLNFLKYSVFTVNDYSIIYATWAANSNHNGYTITVLTCAYANNTRQIGNIIHLGFDSRTNEKKNRNRIDAKTEGNLYKIELKFKIPAKYTTTDILANASSQNLKYERWEFIRANFSSPTYFIFAIGAVDDSNSRYILCDTFKAENKDRPL